jgi:uncharacterized membrane protein YqhA
MAAVALETCLVILASTTSAVLPAARVADPQDLENAAMAKEPQSPSHPDASSTVPTSLPVQLLLGTAKATMVVGIVSLIIAAAILLLFGAVETFRHIVKLVAPAGAELTNREMFLASIKLVDLVLLATVLQVVAIGLYALFIDSDIPVPHWLRTGDVDKLKQKLAGIVAVMLSVLFLEQVINAAVGPELLTSGIAIAAVILALSYFIRSHLPRQ